VDDSCSFGCIVALGIRVRYGRQLDPPATAYRRSRVGDSIDHRPESGRLILR